MTKVIHHPTTDIGTHTFGPHGPATSFDYVPGGGQSVAISVVADQDGTCQIFEVYENGQTKSLGAAVAFSANDGDGEDAEIHFVDYPVTRLRAVYINATGTAGTVSFRAARA